MKYYLLAMLAVVLIGGLYLVFWNLLNQAANLPMTKTNNLMRNNSLASISDVSLSLLAKIRSIFSRIELIKWDFSIFKDLKFTNLKEFGRPPDVDERGRTNPFEPY